MPTSPAPTTAIFNASVLTAVPIFDKKTSQPLVNIITPYIHKDTVFVSYEDYWEDLQFGMLSDGEEWSEMICKSIKIKNEIVLKTPDILKVKTWQEQSKEYIKLFQ